MLLEDPMKIKGEIYQFARELPAEVYEDIICEVFPSILSMEEPSLGFLDFVVDANIIVGDSFRVGMGKQSSTERIFSSKFVKLYAPKSIESEVFTQIKKDLPKGCSSEIAIYNARKLLSKIELVDDSIFELEHSELRNFQEKFGNDASFLKVGIGLGVKRIISRDRAFDESPTVKRFELRDAVYLIVTAESGALSISVIVSSTYIGAQAIYWLLLSLYKTLFYIYGFLAVIISAGISGLVNVLKKIPDWAWYIIIAISAIAGVALIFSKDFKDNVNKVIDSYSWITHKSEQILNALSNILKGSVEIAEIFKDELGPYFMNVGLAMMMSIEEMEKILDF